MLDIDRCRFSTSLKSCSILFCLCDGHNSNCKFYKSDRQFIEEQDRAIDLCRGKGICEKCKYKNVPCKKSTE